MLYRIKENSTFLRMIKKRASGVNTYLIVNYNNEPILTPDIFNKSKLNKDLRIMIGFDRLELIK